MKYLLMAVSPGVTTGYGMVAHNLMKGFLKNKVDIKQLGMQTPSTPLGKEKKWLLPVLNDIYGADALQHYIPSLGIDYVVSIIDNFAPPYFYVPKYVKQQGCGYIAHVTENGIPLGTSNFEALKDADFMVAPSKFVETQLLNVFPKEKVRMIYHGVDTKIFKPLPKLEMEKFKQEIGYKDKFVFLSVATNTGAIQKNWGGVFYAYKIFLSQNPEANKDTILHCQTNMKNPAGFDLELLAKKFGIEKNVSYIDVTLNTGFPPEEMVKLYNISDCSILAGMGESFGLPMLEGMACGLPQIFPNHTTGPELVGEPKTGLLVEVVKMKNGQEFGMTAPSMNDRFWPDPVDMAEKMAMIYKDKKLREKFSKNGIKFAKKFDWQRKIIPQWINFFKYVEEFREPVDYSSKKLGI